MLEHGHAIAQFPDALDERGCAKIIETFEAEPDKKPGVVFTPAGHEEVDRSLKRSTDFLIKPDSGPAWMEVDELLSSTLQRALAAYSERYRFLPNLPTSFCAFQIQRTSVGEFFNWHADEDRRRRLAIIFYLNDEFDGGQTEFEYQNFVYQPKRGSLLLFPPYWTHVHRGRPVERGVKYIATAFLLHVE